MTINPDLFPILGSILVALIIGGLGFAGGIWAFRKNRADAAESIVISAMAIVEQYKASLKECNDERENFNKDHEEIVKRAETAEARAIAAESKVLEMDKTITYLRNNAEESAKDRAALHELIGVLETQLEGLGYVPRSKTMRTRKTDKKE